ncbi:MAG TPA: alpha/beta fold hydrolase [Polyangiaceae bacterium]|nr:alpha/beta fold hydrolase [Polyangiaceae bacterium]
MLSLVPKPAPAPKAAPPRIECSYRIVHGYRRAFVHAGSGSALLLIHGIGDSSDTWQGVIAELARHYTVVAPDLLGHGRSEKPRADYSIGGYANAMRDLLSILDIDRATIIGHSLGGGVAMQFAYQYPERCERLILVSTGGVSRGVTPMLRLMAAPNADFFLPLLGLPHAHSVARGAAAVLRALRTDLGRDADDWLRVFETLPDATARRAFVRTLRAVVDVRGQAVTMLDRAYLARYLPTLLVWGDRDAVIPVEHAELAHRALPGSRLEVFRGAGHFPHHADPERFLSVVRDFLETTEPAPHDVTRWREMLRAGNPALAGGPETPALRA